MIEPVVSAGRRRWRRPSGAAAGRVMIGVGVTGIVLALASTIVGLRLIGEVSTSADRSLDVTTDALAAVADSVAVSNAVLTTLDDGLTTISDTVETLATSLDDATTTLTDTSELLTGTLPDAIRSIDELLPAAETAATAIDRALRALASAPFGPEYDPPQPLDDTIAGLSDAISPLPEELRTLGEGLDDLAASAADATDQVEVLQDDLDDLDRRLGDVALLLDRYAATTAEARTVAAESRRDLVDSASLARVMLVLLGFFFAAGQIVPIWLGLSLLDNDGPPTTRPELPV